MRAINFNNWYDRNNMKRKSDFIIGNWLIFHAFLNYELWGIYWFSFTFIIGIYLLISSIRRCENESN